MRPPRPASSRQGTSAARLPSLATITHEARCLTLHPTSTVRPDPRPVPQLSNTADVVQRRSSEGHARRGKLRADDRCFMRPGFGVTLDRLPVMTDARHVVRERWKSRFVRHPGPLPSAPTPDNAMAQPRPTLRTRRFTLTGRGVGARAAIPQALPYRGVNVAGAEFGDDTIPGTLHQTHTYPDNDILRYFLAKGFGTIRLPFRWERVQPTLNGRLDASELAEISRVVECVEAAAGFAILDMHNYGRRKSPGSKDTADPRGPAIARIVGESDGAVTKDHFADFWGKIAARFKRNPGVLFELFNEPNDQSTLILAQTCNAAISAIRAAGATQPVIVPGNGWSSGLNWRRNGNTLDLFPNINDPAGNTLFAVHQYLDEDGSGRGAAPVTGAGASRLVDVTQWARGVGAKLILTETGFADNPAGRAEGAALLDHLHGNADVWQGWTFWAGGAQSNGTGWWPDDYVYLVNPRGVPGSYVDRPLIGALARHLDFHAPPGPVANLIASQVSDAVAALNFDGARNGTVYEYRTSSAGANAFGAWARLSSNRRISLPAGAPTDIQVRGRNGGSDTAGKMSTVATLTLIGRDRSIEGQPAIVEHFTYTNTARASLTVLAAPNRVLLVSVFGSNLNLLTGVSCNGMPMIPQVSAIAPGVSGVAIYALANPRVGAAEIVAQYAAGQYKLTSVIAQVLTNVDQMRPVEATARDGGFGPDIANTIVTRTDGARIWSAMNTRQSPGNVIIGSGQVEVIVSINPDQNLGWAAASSKLINPTTRATMTYSLPEGANWSCASVALRPA